jgi:hypothetical protein
MDNNLLNELKPIHLPNTVSIFPLAPGWYFVSAVVVIVGIILAIYVGNLRKKKRLLNNEIFQILAEIEKKSKCDSNQFILGDITILLKRVAILRFPEAKPQSLYGENWLKFLDKSGKTDDFTQGEGKVLANIYSRYTLVDNSNLIFVVKRWLRKVL